MEHSRPPGPVSSDALFRFYVVSLVKGRVLRGQRLSAAVSAVASERHATPDGGSWQVGKRSIYRWLRLFEAQGIVGLERRARTRSKASEVLPQAFLDFLVQEKGRDPDASVPELIKRARQLGTLSRDAKVCRQTVYRACRRLGLPMRRRTKQRGRDARRFAYPHRMQMVLCDGKHFRAGAARRRRVVLFFLDDCSRCGLHAVVGTSESAALLLRGLHEVVRRYGFMDLFYLDRGPGGIADDTARVCARLGPALVLGEASYPEGRGKIERFNRTAKADLIRHLDRRPEVDPDCGALELRFQHYLREVYNHDPHESLPGEGRLLTPWERFSSDARDLRLPESEQALREAFVLPERRTVSADHVVPIDGVKYEVPRGLRGEIVVHRSLLDGSLRVLHEGRLVEIHPVDPAQNAVAQRARRSEAPEDVAHPLPKSAAELSFEEEWDPLPGPDGGFTFTDDQE